MSEVSPAVSKIPDDLLYGADEIARFVFGRRPKTGRAVYHLHYKGVLPTFKIGGVLCASKVEILKFYNDVKKTNKLRPAPHLKAAKRKRRR